MAFLFKAKQKTPAELVKSCKELLVRGDAIDNKQLEECSKILLQIKNTLYAPTEQEEVNQELVSQLAQEIYAADLLQLLVQHMNRLEFEAKKDASQIFNNLLRRQIGTRSPTVEYLSAKPDILVQLVCSYEVADIALQCGLVLRECIRYEPLCKLLYSAQDPAASDKLLFWRMFAYVDLGTFDVASDAFATFKELLTRHRTVVAEFLDKHYDAFFERYTLLLTSQNYVTKRQSLKLLGELLLDRSNFTVMTRYIASTDNLKLMMNLLRDKSKNIQFEAFHVFKVFVANPNK